MLALLMRTSRDSTASTARWICAGSVTSRVRGVTRPSGWARDWRVPAYTRLAPRARASLTSACPMPRLAPVTRTALPAIDVMMTISFSPHVVVQPGRAGVARPGQVAALSRDLLDPVCGFRWLGRWDGTVEVGGGRSAAQDGGCGPEGEQGDRSADPQGPVEAAGQRDVGGLSLAEQGAHVGGGDRRCDRDAER